MVRNRKIFVLALAIVMAIVSAAVFAPLISPHDPNEVNLEMKLSPPGFGHLLGTDHLGRDIFSRLIYGARVSVATVAAIILLVLAFGLGIGILAGYAGGIVDAALMRLCDVFFTFPTFVLALFMVGIPGAGMGNVIIAIALTHWAWYARIVRGLVLTFKYRDYILAARAAGTGRIRIVVRHILPPVFSQLVILATMDIGHMMLHVSGLSFLGLGITPPTPEWGVMVSDAREYIWTQPSVILWPGMMIFLTVMSFNLIGDVVRDGLDSKGKGDT